MKLIIESGIMWCFLLKGMVFIVVGMFVVLSILWV